MCQHFYFIITHNWAWLNCSSWEPLFFKHYVPDAVLNALQASPHLIHLSKVGTITTAMIRMRKSGLRVLRDMLCHPDGRSKGFTQILTVWLQSLRSKQLHFPAFALTMNWCSQRSAGGKEEDYFWRNITKAYRLKEITLWFEAAKREHLI